MLVSFWFGALLLCVLAAAAVLWPLVKSSRRGLDDRTDINVLFYRDRLGELDASLGEGEIDDREYAELENELQRALLADARDEAASTKTGSRLPLVAAPLVVLLALVTYGDFGLSFGSLGDLVLSEEIGAVSGDDVEGSRATMAKLAARLATQPDNDRGWFLLAQSWRNISEHENAASAFRHLATRYPGDASLASAYAESLYLADERQMTLRVKSAIDQALVLDANNLTLLEISAMAAYQRGEVDQALGFFERAIATGVEGERAELLKHAMARLQSELSQSAAPAAGDRALRVLVEVAEGVEVNADDVVYIYARAFGGSPMPLAVQRLAASALPALVTLTPAQAMMKGMSLNDVDQVQLVARITASGMADAAPDDYEVRSDEIDMTAQNPVIKLTIALRRDQQGRG